LLARLVEIGLDGVALVGVGGVDRPCVDDVDDFDGRLSVGGQSEGVRQGLFYRVGAVCRNENRLIQDSTQVGPPLNSIPLYCLL